MLPIAILTRPAGRNEALAGKLSKAGWQVLALPALALAPLAEAGPPPAPADFDLVVFVSGSAARLYLERLSLPEGWPSGTLAATVGAASAQALREHARFGAFFDAPGRVLHPRADAPTHDSEALWQLLSQRPLPRRVLLVRGETGRDWLADRLTEAGAQVLRHALYRREAAVWSQASTAKLRAWSEAGRLPMWLLTSAAGIDAVADAVRQAGLFDWWVRNRFVVTHPRLNEYLLAVAASSGQSPAVKNCMPADEAVFEAMIMGAPLNSVEPQI